MRHAHRRPIRASLAAALLALFAACSGPDLRGNPGWVEGRARAEVEFAAGTAQPILMCGTIAPGACSSVEQERYELAFAGGYNERLDELETPGRSPR